MDTIAQKVEALKSEMIGDRRFFHSHPETGWFTFFTTAVIADRMQRLGYEIKLGREVVKAEARQGVGSKDACEKAKQRAKELLNADQIKFLDAMEDGLTGLVAEIDTGRAGKTDSV